MDLRFKFFIKNLANLVSFMSIAGTMIAITDCMNGRFDRIGWLFLFSVICDGLDGFIARATKTQSQLGVELDSLIDMVSFGIGPMVVAYGYTSAQGSPLPLGLLIVYSACTALRLARFNLQEDKSKFLGLNSPSAAALVIFLIWLLQDVYHGDSPRWGRSLIMLTIACTSLMMITNISYLSTKKLRFKVGPIQLLIASVLIVIIFKHTPYALYTLMLIYALSGPFAKLLRILTKQYK